MNQVEGEIAIISREQVVEADYNLSPSRWVGHADDVSRRPIRELVAEIRRLDDEAREIDESLMKLLGNLE